MLGDRRLGQPQVADQVDDPVLAQGEVLDDEAITGIAEAHGKTPGQVVIRWHLQLGNVVIPKSVTPSRIRENIDVFDFSLDEEDLAQIQRLETGTRVGLDPRTLG